MNNYNIYKYNEYLIYCQKFQSDDPCLSNIIELFRVIYNSIKHSPEISLALEGDPEQNIILNKKELLDFTLVNMVNDGDLQTDKEIEEFETEEMSREPLSHFKMRFNNKNERK